MANSCDNQPIRLVLALANELSGIVGHAAKAAGLTPQQARVLMQLEEPRRMCELAAQQSLDPSSITSLVDRLERDGLVLREPDPSDGRVRRVALTAVGLQTRARFFAEFTAQPDPFAALTPEQRRALVERLGSTGEQLV